MAVALDVEHDGREEGGDADKVAGAARLEGVGRLGDHDAEGAVHNDAGGRDHAPEVDGRDDGDAAVVDAPELLVGDGFVPKRFERRPVWIVRCAGSNETA